MIVLIFIKIHGISSGRVLYAAVRAGTPSFLRYGTAGRKSQTVSLMIVLYNKMKVFCKKFRKKSIRMRNIEIRYSIGTAPGTVVASGDICRRFLKGVIP